MSEERKGLSLRTKRQKRPPISAPTPIPQAVQTSQRPTPFGDAKLDLPPQRPRAGGKTSDLVQRRYSTRFNVLPSEFDAAIPPVPGIPSIPNASQYATGGFQAGRGPSPTRGTDLTVDLNAIKDPDLQAGQYVSQLLSDASEQQIYGYQQSLKRMRNRTSLDLQQSVYQNRTQFIKIGKETENLKGEMRALRNLMAELKTNTTALRSASSTNESTIDEGLSSALSRRDRRSSVADRTQLWNSQLQALWKSVEGSQKFLPAEPGRHVIQDAGVWIELDNATWKPRRSMVIFLLNDHLLVASRKKKRVDNGTDPRSAPSKIVAERCWPLLDVEMVDLAGTSGSGGTKMKVADAIMIRGTGQESFTYREERPDRNNKATLLSNFRKQVEDLRRELRSEIETNNKAKETINYFASRDPGLLKRTEILENLSDVRERPNMLIEVDGKQQNLRWVEGQVDELDVDIALQRFDSAVDRVEKLNSLCKSLKSNTVAQNFINFKTEERASKLATLVTRELIDTHNELKKTKRNVSWLARLGFEDRAREAYLEARSHIIQKRWRQCIFRGNFLEYIWEVSFVYFTLIRNTVSCFLTCFPPIMMSACVKWAKEQVDAFNLILARQLSSVDQDNPIWHECIEQAKTHASMLSDVGLDFENLISVDVEVKAANHGPIGLGLG